MQAFTAFYHPQLKMLGYIQAGFPTAAEEELVDTLSLDQYLITNPAASFMLKATNDAMVGAGIHPNDLVIVERGRKPADGDVVLASVDGEWRKYHTCFRPCRISGHRAIPRTHNGRSGGGSSEKIPLSKFSI